MADGKDIVYERDYRDLRKIFKDHTYSNKKQDVVALAHELGVLKAIDDRIREFPYIINPKGKDDYDDCLVVLEQYAAEIGGKIRGVVSYETFDACIYLDLPFHEFMFDRMDDLRFIAENASSVCFSIIEDNFIRLSVCFPYFENIGDTDAIIEEELKKRPEICAMLEEAKEAEVKQILADPLMVAMIEPQAEKAGMTVEDYVRSVQTMIDDYPEPFMAWLGQKLKDKHNELSHEE